MKRVKNIVVRVDGRAFTIEVDISEDEVISTMISSLAFFISRGSAVRITHTSKQPLSTSQSMSSRILKNIPELNEWIEDLKRLLRVQGVKLFPRG